MRGRVLVVVAALGIHAAVLLFGGLPFRRPAHEAATQEEVELIDDAAPQKHEEEKKTEKPAEEAKAEKSEETIEAAQEQAPDVQDLARLESAAAAPALEPLSLAELEGALDPTTDGGMMAESFRLSSGGRIGGTGTGLASAPEMETVISAGELDQKPRPLFQTAPHYPPELRRRHLEGTVHLVFLVDEQGRVQDPKVDDSSDPAFERAALEAVRQWTFEPGTRGGEKVRFKMRIPITFRAG